MASGYWRVNLCLSFDSLWQGTVDSDAAMDQHHGSVLGVNVCEHTHIVTAWKAPAVNSRLGGDPSLRTI